MENNILCPKKYANVILHLSQEMHCHVHVANHPQDFSNGSTDEVDLANISAENEALASEYAEAISVLSELSNAATKAEQDADILLEEELLLQEGRVLIDNGIPVVSIEEIIKKD